MQVLSYQSDVLSHKQQSKRLQEDNQRLQNQMLATGERLEKMTHDSTLDLKKEMLKLQRQLAGKQQCLCCGWQLLVRCDVHRAMCCVAMYALAWFRLTERMKQGCLVVLVVLPITRCFHNRMPIAFKCAQKVTQSTKVNTVKSACLVQPGCFCS